MILNLGSGESPTTGLVNVDHRPGPGVQVVADAQRLPFQDDIAEAVLASHVLEHVERFDLTIEEVHRVLKPGGLLIARVPYGMRSLYNPYHRRPFNEVSIRMLLTPESVDLDRQAVGWRLVRMVSKREGEWHAAHYLGLPLGRKGELLFVLEALK